MNTEWEEYIVMLANDDYAEFRAESVGDAIKQCDRQYDGMSWRLYRIEPDGKVGTNCLANATGGLITAEAA